MTWGNLVIELIVLCVVFFLLHLSISVYPGTKLWVLPWYRYFPKGAGVGSHVHLSIWNGENNVLMGKGSGSKHGMSKQGQEFMAGVLHHLPAIFAMTCPIPNRSVAAQFGPLL